MPRINCVVSATFLVVSLTSCSIPAARAERVGAIQQLSEALARAKPGTVIEIADGNYELTAPLVLSARGTADRPVTIRAESVGGVRFTGTGHLRIRDADSLVIEGITLAHQARTLDVTDSNRVRLTRLTLAYVPSRESKEGRHVPWIRFRGGEGHRVDHCDIGPHVGGLGVTLLVDNDVRGIRIDHNYFHDRPRDGRNGAETIRLGGGGRSTINATVEDNLFQNCNGEAEIVSIKSSGNVIRGNTFRDNFGQLVVRAGNDLVIERNQFIGGSAEKRSGGVRVHGSDIRIADNYFQDLTMPALESGPGHPHSPAALADRAGGGKTGIYWQSVNVTFTGNLIVDSAAADGAEPAPPRSRPVIQLELPGKGTPASNDVPPDDWKITDNVFVTAGPLIGKARETRFTWQNNSIWVRAGSPELGRDFAPGQFERRDPQMEKSQGTWRLRPTHGKSGLPPGLAKKSGGTSAAPAGGGALPAPLTPAQVGPES